jgi:enoyl-CoA hydratase/carnithine racemase
VVPDDQVVTRARELADRIAGHPLAGRRAVGAIWRRLRSDPADPDAWFASLAAGPQR